HVAFGAIFGLANRLQRTIDSVLPDITAKQFWVMLVLSLFDEPPTLSELAQAADTSHQNVRQLLKKLEAKGFVKLTPDAKDSRALRIVTTPAADEWGASTDAQAEDFLSAIFAGVTPAELDRLAQTLLTIHSTLDQMDHSKH
ncbi:MAG: MarR family transcriptional regulator, partial [Propionibacteriaceae bacterium]|nr:MarR family transcriptional regulator [Propionibacteriaceae bacterium]